MGVGICSSDIYLVITGGTFPPMMASWPEGQNGGTLVFLTLIFQNLYAFYTGKPLCRKKRHVCCTGIRTFMCILILHMLLHLGTLTSGKLPSQHVSFLEQPFGSPLNKTEANSSSVSHPAGVRHQKIPPYRS